MGKKKILIIFPYPHLAYSPTLLNLTRLLRSAGHAVKIVYGFEEFFGKHAINLEGVDLEEVSYSRKTIRVAKHVNRFVWKPLARILQALSWLTKYNRLSIREILFSRIINKALSTAGFDELIAVDMLPLYWASRRDLYCHFLSLEVDDAIQLVDRLNKGKIKSVVIQSPERYMRLFRNADLQRFIIQNAPIFEEPKERTVASKKLVYNGTVWAPFGVMNLMEFARQFPEYEIHFKGAVHTHTRNVMDGRFKDLTTSGRLIFSESYLDENELKTYLARCSIGFCLYDFQHPLIADRRFNYETAPSGKVFLYLSIGMPVIATRIEGFRFIEEADAGVLIEDHSPQSIRSAVETILNQYQHYSDNALELGRNFSFDVAARPFVDFISK